MSNVKNRHGRRLARVGMTLTLVFSTWSAWAGIVESPAATCPPGVSCGPGGPGGDPCTPLMQQLHLCTPGGGGGGTCHGNPGGSPSCPAASPSSTSSGAGGAVQLGGGNPINLVTGNKYQEETDLDALPGVLGLELRRHYNSLSTHAGLMGAGWHMSYETLLYDMGGQVQIVQADGQRLMFARGEGERAALCTTPRLQDGQVRLVPDGHGHIDYVWRWPDGRTLTFSGGSGGGHPLQSITAPGGEQLTLTYSPSGELVQVRDPQGRKLSFIYSGARRELQAIETPLGRIDYTLDLRGRLVQVAERTGAGAPALRTRIYHYDDAAHVNALTGISLRSPDAATHKDVEQRLSTYAYDAEGLAVMTTKGEPRRLKDGKPVPGTGIEQVDVAYLEQPLEAAGKPDKSGEVQPGQFGRTEITNSLGKKSVLLSAMIGGHYRLMQLTGAGCSTCGPTDMRYAYDAAGQLRRAIKLDALGRPVSAEVTEYDDRGRVAREGTQAYAPGGRPQPTRWLARYEYDDVRYRDGSIAFAPHPSLIAEPSVVPGSEHQLRFAYNARWQVTQLTETGFSPLDDHGQPSPQGFALSRTTTYRYVAHGQRSLLAEVAGPAPDGAGPDAGKTRFEYDADGNFITAVIRPGGLRESVRRDAATGLVIESSGADGIVTRFHRGADGRVVEALRAGEVLSRRFDAEGRLTGISDAAGRRIELGYDLASQLSSVVDAQGWRTQIARDTEGDAVSTSLYEPGASQPLRASYRWFDAQRRPVRQLFADGRLDTWHYDVQGRVDEHFDGDGILHVGRHNDTTGASAEIDLATDGQLRASLKTPPGGRADIRSPLRDDFGRTVSAWMPGQGIRLWRFDAADQLVEERRLDRDAALASVTAYGHDAAGHTIRRTNRDAAGHVLASAEWRYEGARLVQSDDATETRRFAYDAAGHVSATTIALKDTHGAVAFSTTLADARDTGGSVVTRTLADGSVLHIERQADTRVARRLSVRSAAWERFGQWLARWLPDAWSPTVIGWLPSRVVVSDIGFRPVDGIVRFQSGNGLDMRKDFDFAGRVSAQRIGATGAALVETRFEYGLGQRIRAIDTPAASRRFEYDGFGRLDEPAAARPIETSFGASARPVVDTQGRVVADGKLHYTYTPGGQVETVSDAAGHELARYAYNAQSQRVSKTLADGHATRYLWQDGLLVAEMSDAGAIDVQYLYLGDDDRFAPVAKLEGAHAQGNPTGAARLLFVHADYRGQPVAMTDEARQVVWRGEADSWGWLHVADGARATLNLRLPGQYFDAETGLHDNWHRSYDPRPQSPHHGRYLSPDPMGYPDGPDARAYVGGDPVNRVDPTGLYEEDVHYYATYFLAIVAGLSPTDAQTIASADRYIDDNPCTEPFGTMGTNFSARQDYHFTQDGYDPKTQPGEIIVDPVTLLWHYSDGYIVRRVDNPTNPQLTRLHGYAMGSSNPCTRDQFYGEYLHAFEDTFAHRDADNVPYGYKLGHLAGGHDPDHTYDDRANGFVHNEERTLEMEQELFNKFQTDFGVEAKDKLGLPITWADIESTMKTFDENTSPETALDPKIAILNDKLAALGFDPIVPYSCSASQKARNDNLVDANCAALQQSNYPGTILKTPTPTQSCK